MFDKEKIARMTDDLIKFVSIYPNIYIIPESLTADIFMLLKRLNVNIVGVMTNSPVVPGQSKIPTPAGIYPCVHWDIAIKSFDFRTGIIIAAEKPAPNPMFPVVFKADNSDITTPALAMTNEEAMAIYDRLTLIYTLKQYEEDGINYYIKETSMRFARGISTFLDSRYREVKIQFWDRRGIVMPKYDIDAAIVMQGPIQYMDNYTLTTARLYREWYPNSPIVISTWQGEATQEFKDECRKISIAVLENEVPPESGALHVNYQLESSLKGVEFVRNNTSAKFVLKCRTDQRLNRADFLIYFKNLLKMFPPNGDKLNARIITFDGQKWAPFFVCDFIYFGALEDMHKLFSVPRQTSDESAYFMRTRSRFHKVMDMLAPFKFFPNFNLMDQRKLRNYNVMEDKFEPPETFILKSFYRKFIAPIDKTKLLQTYWKFLRDYMIIVEKSVLLMDWPKYFVRHAEILSYYETETDFARWLDIYLNYKDE